jgi:hypothetical protein
MGNKQGDGTLNATKDDVGKKMFDRIKKKRDAIKGDPMYVKDRAPVMKNSEYQKGVHDPISEPIHEEETHEKAVINEDIKRIKELLSYNKKTQ